MQFSKLKKTTESFLCDSLKGRVKLHLAKYRHSHDERCRIWFTYDKKEIFSAADLSFHIAHFYRESQLKKELKLKPIPYNKNLMEMLNSPERKALIEASELAEKELLMEGLMASWHVYPALLAYPNLTIEQALNSENSIIRAFALFDKRVGKRRLLKIEQLSSSIEVQFYTIRCEVENIHPFYYYVGCC